jgi:DNA-binding NtrC family response regulator
MIFEDGTLIAVGHLAIGPDPRPAAEAESAGERTLSLPEAERDMIVRALQSTNGNVSRASRILGISRDTLRYKLKKMKGEAAS